VSDRPKKDKFRPNPFKSLKGFCASAPEKPSKPAPQSKPEAAEDDATVFAREMKRLGLEAPEPESDPSVRESAHKEQEAAAETRKAPPTDRELFLEALGTMETTFSDDFPVEEELRAEPRRMRQLRKGKIVPEAHLDLHGLSRVEARQKVRYFLENAAHHGLRTVLLVTGQGKSSGSEPVVRAEVELFLQTEGKTLVREWGRAPRQFGGDGAIVVFMRGEK
jgi:DNA-nicking Smr family endonuclease